MSSEEEVRVLTRCVTRALQSGSQEDDYGERELPECLEERFHQAVFKGQLEEVRDAPAAHSATLQRPSGAQVPRLGRERGLDGQHGLGGVASGVPAEGVGHCPGARLLALDRAVLKGFAKLLLERKASATLVGMNGWTVRVLCAERVPFFTGRQPLHYAAHADDMDVMKILLERGADKMAFTVDGKVCRTVDRLIADGSSRRRVTCVSRWLLHYLLPQVLAQPCFAVGHKEVLLLAPGI